MQSIRYNVRRSSFYPAIEAALRGWKDRSQPIQVQLSSGGYERDLHFTVSQGNADTFVSTWKGAEQRFSARLRAAATVLRDHGFTGEYHASHRDGIITLTQIR
jgi:hypothetical protein